VALGPLSIVSVVLVLAGTAKVTQPREGEGALRALGLRVPAVVVRGFGAGEVGLGLYAIAFGGRTAGALVALLYAGFAVAALRLRAVDASCGCFGAASSTPPGGVHVAVNGAAAAIGVWAAATRTGGVVDQWRELPALGIPHALLVAAGAAGVLALLTDLGATLALARGGRTVAPVPVQFGPVRRAQDRPAP
jgi:hypothetical protein